MKIAIDLGHGVSYDTGAESSFIREETIIDGVGRLVISKLKKLGHEVIEVRPETATSLSNSLVQRVQKSNSNNVDLYVSIHANAGGGKGTEVYTYRGTEVAQARNVLNNLVSLGFTNRGIRGKNLFVINNTSAIAMLIEICFIDTKSDVDMYNSLGAEKIADGIVKGLVGNTVSLNTSQASKTSVNTSAKVVNKSNISFNLKDWQKAYNESRYGSILVDGIMGNQTNTAMHKAILKQGCNNPLVGWLQCRIGADIDNVFGTETRRKVLEFQKDNGLIQDGIVGACTWSKLFEKYSN